VGSSEQAAQHFGGHGDFGIPAQQAQPRQQTIIDDTHTLQVWTRPHNSLVPQMPDRGHSS
jgi:hypothetical protein